MDGKDWHLLYPGGVLPAVYLKNILEVYPESEQEFYESIRVKPLEEVQDIYRYR